jgi:hypothetical protein
MELRRTTCCSAFSWLIPHTVSFTLLPAWSRSSVAFSGFSASRTFFRIFGIIYAIVAVLGFYNGDQPLLGLISNNTADTWLHVALAVIMLLLGFGASRGTTATA